MKIKYIVLGILYQGKNYIRNLDVLCNYSKYPSIITRPFGSPPSGPIDSKIDREPMRLAFTKGSPNLQAT